MHLTGVDITEAAGKTGGEPEKCSFPLAPKGPLHPVSSAVATAVNYTAQGGPCPVNSGYWCAG